MCLWKLRARFSDILKVIKIRDNVLLKIRENMPIMTKLNHYVNVTFCCVLGQDGGLYSYSASLYSGQGWGGLKQWLVRETWSNAGRGELIIIISVIMIIIIMIIIMIMIMIMILMILIIRIIISNLYYADINLTFSAAHHNV